MHESDPNLVSDIKVNVIKYRKRLVKVLPSSTLDISDHCKFQLARRQAWQRGCTRKAKHKAML